MEQAAVIYDWFGYALPLRERYRLIRAAGFDGVMLWWSNDFGRGDAGWDNYREAVGLARSEGLRIENIHAPVAPQHALWEEGEAGEAAMACYRGCMEDCAAYGIPTMVLHLPGCHRVPGAVAEERVAELAACAERLGVNVAVENLGNAENVAFVLSHTSSPRVGFCYDCCHHWNHEPEVDYLARYGQRLLALHLHDNGGLRHQHQLPFDGQIAWDEVMHSLSAAGYTGPLALEPMNWDYTRMSPEEFLRTAYDRVCRLRGLGGMET